MSSIGSFLDDTSHISAPKHIRNFSICHGFYSFFYFFSVLWRIFIQEYKQMMWMLCTAHFYLFIFFCKICVGSLRFLKFPTGSPNGSMGFLRVSFCHIICPCQTPNFEASLKLLDFTRTCNKPLKRCTTTRWHIFCLRMWQHFMVCFVVSKYPHSV